MTIYDIYGKISPHFRQRRMALFLERFRPDAKTRILDVGGYPGFWQTADVAAHVTSLNLVQVEVPAEIRHRCVSVAGDGTNLPYADSEFDIVFSNSVVEHLGTWEMQQRFAREVRRVGRRYWVQTPAQEFPIEPHLIAPFFHWLPRGAQRRVMRYGTPLGLLTKPTPAQVESLLDELRLLNFREVRVLFPDGEIVREKLVGLTKSYTAIRNA